MPNSVETPKAKKGIGWLLALLVVLVACAVALVVALSFNSSNKMGSYAAQDDTETIEASKSSKPQVTNASTQVTNLVSLMGLSTNDAVVKIGHGASIQEEAPMSSIGFSKEETVALTNEKGDSLSGTPTVTLGFDDNDGVVAASYTAATSLLGYGSIAFADAVQKYHIVENTLYKAGLTTVEEGSVELPSKTAYSTYGPDRKTLVSETYTFQGTADMDGVAYTWNATLDYDYTQANKESDLSKTVKKITVSVMRA